MQFHKIYTLLFTLCLSSFWGIAQKENSVFWQVVSPNKKDTSYLFGTIHMLPAEKFYLPDTIKNCLIRSSVSYFELDLKVPQEEVMAALKLPEGKSLFDFVNQAQKDSLLAFAESYMGIDSVMFSYAISPYKPFIFTQLPMAAYALKAIGYDDVLQKTARENKVEVKALETHLQQISFFDQMPEHLQTEMIMEVIRQTKNMEEELIKLQDNYLTQNTDFFLKEFEDKSEMNEYMYEHILKQRNDAWVKILKKELKGKQAFIAVGAAHLVGTDGLVNQLRNEKFTLTPIQMNLKP